MPACELKSDSTAPLSGHMASSLAASRCICFNFLTLSISKFRELCPKSPVGSGPLVCAGLPSRNRGRSQSSLGTKKSIRPSRSCSCSSTGPGATCPTSRQGAPAMCGYAGFRWHAKIRVSRSGSLYCLFRPSPNSAINVSLSAALLYFLHL